MQANLEVLEGLVRRLDISVPMDPLETEVQTRLKRLARNVKMHGFRPGKAPLAAVARQHGLTASLAGDDGGDALILEPAEEAAQLSAHDSGVGQPGIQDFDGIQHHPPGLD